MNNSMILVGSHTSPYVRKLRLFLLNANIAHEFKAINYLEKSDSDYLKSISPINKIPILEHKGKMIYDSRVIFNYLSNLTEIPKLTLEEENYLTFIDTLLESTINLFMIKRSGITIDPQNTFFDRQINRIDLLLKSLDQWATDTNQWNYLTMSLFSYLEWAIFRQMISEDKYQFISTFRNKFKNAPYASETQIII